ncbi:hypothetical protein [Photobacterium salinisoli]|uniref:hypothetical protein n=1 Tax=Photobacterium salinisoli TaxID=1616783 RepID=UPI001F09CE6A|nr:hypothetical protein [Photobacterium salinisoli]
MFAVIFKAKTGEQDSQYAEMVKVMRDLAFEKYGCLDFIAVTEGVRKLRFPIGIPKRISRTVIKTASMHWPSSLAVKNGMPPTQCRLWK